MKITGICWLIMTALVDSFFLTDTGAERPIPYTCEGFSDPNAVCNTSDDGSSRTIRCLRGYRYIGDSPNCLPEGQFSSNVWGPLTCADVSAVNAYCDVTDNGWGKNIRCHAGYIYLRDSDKCLLNKHPDARPRSRETCEYFSDVNEVCKVKTDGSGKYIHCRPGYVQPLGSDECISKATIQGSRTCDGFSAANAVCKVIDNGWALDIRCRDGYIGTPHSGNCVPKESDNTARQ